MAESSSDRNVVEQFRCNGNYNFIPRVKRRPILEYLSHIKVVKAFG